MRLRVLAKSKNRILGVEVGGECPSEAFLSDSEAEMDASRIGMRMVLNHLCEHNFDSVSNWIHQVNKTEKIYEIKKGRLRLFFFRGDGSDIAICTTGLVKKTQKVDPSAIAKAVSMKTQYWDAVARNAIKVITDDDIK